jgi:hypothetical protein
MAWAAASVEVPMLHGFSTTMSAGAGLFSSQEPGGSEVFN